MLDIEVQTADAWTRYGAHHATRGTNVPEVDRCAVPARHRRQGPPVPLITAPGRKPEPVSGHPAGAWARARRYIEPTPPSVPDRSASRTTPGDAPRYPNSSCPYHGTGKMDAARCPPGCRPRTPSGTRPSWWWPGPRGESVRMAGMGNTGRTLAEHSEQLVTIREPAAHGVQEHRLPRRRPRHTGGPVDRPASGHDRTSPVHPRPYAEHRPRHHSLTQPKPVVTYGHTRGPEPGVLGPSSAGPGLMAIFLKTAGVAPGLTWLVLDVCGEEGSEERGLITCG